ncbi:uncharacterized protein LOC110654602 [Hevea brasiliensis]|uniref:uncharacterized protein LOC110654602 n=1 Tax=Hevea brasiliensis TaxID=3981 RepID=UPI0025F37274|nr:uncharacterized protein LOC110654602 [Hevea brasiliensis]
MLSENRYDSSKITFKSKALDVECASSDVLIKHRSRTILAVRDFPIGCGPSKRFCSEVLKNSVHFDVPGTTDDSKSKEKLIESFDERQELGLVTEVELLHKFLQDSLDNARLVNPLQISVSEATKLPNKAVPRRRISAIRSFPQGCGRMTQQVDKEVAPESVALETNGLGHYTPEVGILLRKKGEATRKDGHQKNLASSGKINMFQSYSKCLEIYQGKLHENDMDKCLDGKLSGHSSIHPSQEIASTHLEVPGNRVIVQALMAAPSCPCRNGKWRSRSKLTNGVAKSKDKKH